MAVIVDTNTAVDRGILTTEFFDSYSALEPTVHRELKARFGDQYSGLMDMLHLMDRKEPISSIGKDIWEENRWYPTLTVGDTFAGGVGTMASPKSMTVTNTAASPLAIRKNQTIMFPDETKALVKSVTDNGSDPSASASTIELVSVGGATMPAASTGDMIYIYSNAWGDGTVQPSSLRVGASKLTVYTQILKETIGMNGKAMTLKTWYNVLDAASPGKGNIVGAYSPGLMQMEHRLEKQIDGAMLWGDEETALLVPSTETYGAGETIYMTKGLIPHIRTRGLTHEIPTGGGFNTDAVTDLDTISLYLKTQGVNSKIALMGLGPNLDSDLQDSLKSYNNGGAGGPDYANIVNTLFGGNQELGMSINFKFFTRQGITYVFWPMDAFLDPTGVGVSSDYVANGMGFVFPYAQYPDAKNPQISVENVNMIYQEKNGYNRMMELWANGAAGGSAYKPYIGEVDAVNWFARADVGLSVCKANQFVLLDPVGAS